MSKKPISFKDHSRKRHMEKLYQRKARRQPREWDDFLDYWHYFLRNPFQVASQGPWTDRMLWSNAIVAGILAALRVVAFIGFHVMFMLSAVINTLFIAFLFYYGLTWVIVWVLNRTEPGRRSYAVDTIRVQAIVYSGWLIVLTLISWIPISGLVYLAGAILVILGIRAVHQLYGVSWPRAVSSMLAGSVSMIAIIMILNHLAAL
ncbi:MAG: hypothetical protein C7B44_02095 [Sulfobacillus thermosulfidooxidans]|uniref:Yip1 domain-containing protein n=1 Tax=Sulfobacillus thermotolerans TaxID=338644 RepID=A0ABM6RTD9_9FIRM|nr:hypothetical protein [Sulfobacillus sp. hq2]AUW94600.1 hypothetical protein BXT84_12135 [Sulfobacillus thermotolerans]MCY0908422.1 hypothetical protein [Sulfobacillus thermotolerans]POB09108.1 hypothetical protein CO251_16175 [Sulfobacillus sp. hq2]PSR37763.1 MAG: hypothetical protein C7B44_02095 [Sulfobacillus thermosulfidooxidans]